MRVRYVEREHVTHAPGKGRYWLMCAPDEMFVTIMKYDDITISFLLPFQPVAEFSDRGEALRFMYELARTIRR